jgi:quercetin dioxygenase-like cupin family protein
MNTKFIISKWAPSACFTFGMFFGLQAHGTEDNEEESGSLEGTVVQFHEHEFHQSPDGNLIVEMMVNPVLVEGAPISMSVLTIEVDALVAEHIHESSVEILYIVEGGGTMTISGQEHTLSPGSAVVIPAGAPHSYVNNSGQRTRALQVYEGPGPEARFRNWEPMEPYRAPLWSSPLIY